MPLVKTLHNSCSLTRVRPGDLAASPFVAQVLDVN